MNDRMLLGSDYEAEHRRQDAMNDALRAMQDKIEMLEAKACGWQLIAKHQREIINGLRARLHEAETA